MKLYQVLDLNNLYASIKDSSMPVKTAYKFAMLMQKAEVQVNFYNEHFKKLLEKYAQKEAGEYKYSDDGQSILVKKGQEEDCNKEMQELQNIEVDFDLTFSLEELEGINLTLSQMTILMPLIKE